MTTTPQTPETETDAGEAAESALNGALQTLTRVYRDEVASIAEDARANLADGTIDGREALDRWTTETVDWHEWVLKPARAQVVCLVSENDDHALSEGLYQPSAGTGIDWSAIAHYAMKQDVWQALEGLGVDLNEPHECSTCGCTYDDHECSILCCEDDDDDATA